MSDARHNPGSGIRDSGFGTRDSEDTLPVELDAAIDAVAREMTAVEPSPALRARVLDRIEQASFRRSPSVRWAWAGAAATVVLAVAAAVWVGRPAQVPGGSGATVAERRATIPQLPAAAQPQRPVETSVRSAAQPALAPRGTRTRPTRGIEPGASELAERRSLVPALADIPPLEFRAVEPGPLQIADVEVAPVPAMPEIDIPSLNPGPNDSQSVDPKKEKQS
jgi:hypothetical protein